MKRTMTLVALLVTLLSPRAARAHDVDVTGVARVFLDQIGERRYLLSIVDAQVQPIANLAAVLPAQCHAITQEEAGVRISRGYAFECEEPLTVDESLRFPWKLAGVVVVVRWGDGSNASAYFRGDGSKVVVPLADLRAGSGSAWRLVGRYVKLGVEHILFGIDHLLFVLGLLLLVRRLRALVATITAFTVAHSITLAAAVLGFVSIPRGPVEASIALSIILLAREIVVGEGGAAHLVHRRPWVVAFIFGLLHGLGFAGALGQIGLRQGDIPLALLSFNVGVELGQLAFIAVVVVLYLLVGPLVRKKAPTLQLVRPLGYGLGILATLWLFQRLPGVWGG